jgi:penicillin-binding protein 1A
VLFAYAGDLPQITALDNYNPSTITRVYAAQGQLIGEFATQRRVVVGYDEINPLLRHGIIATEDTEFERHVGINLWRLVSAAITDIVERRRAQGASTRPSSSRAPEGSIRPDVEEPKPGVARAQDPGNRPVDPD